MIWLIILAAFALRLVTINQSLWLDEAINVNNASTLDFKTLIIGYSLGDFHPPLYHIVLKSWIELFGKSEIAVRFPSVIFGVITVLVTYLIGRKLFERKTALIAATLVATSPLAIYYSQEARMYSLAALFTSFTIYFFVSIIKKENLLLWLGFISSASLALYTDYLPYLLIPILILYVYNFRKKIKKGTLRSFLPSFLLILFALAPWFTVFPKQIKVGLSAAAASPAWAQVVGAPEVKSPIVTIIKFTIGRISIDNNFVYALVFLPIAFFLVLLFIFSVFRISPKRSILWYWLFGPIILAFPLSYFIPVFAYFRFLFALPAFYLILAAGINTVNSQKLIRILLTLMLAINFVSTSIYFINPKFHREDWRSAANHVIQNSTEKTIVLFESNFTVGPFDYYNKNLVPAYGALSSFTADRAFIKSNLTNLTKEKEKVFLFQYLSPITDPNSLVSQELFNLGFTSYAIDDFNGVGFVYEFRR